ncbi:MAG TPA: hypothetical protein VKN18_16155 [Blastocatellia bacterium]|nr:hypothetical protein [Blastocatellia bacterium]
MEQKRRGCVGKNQQNEREDRVKIKRIIFAGVFTALIAFSAIAEAKSKSITFSKAVTVNGVTIDPGSYKVEFDSGKNELSIAKGRKVLATATAHVETASTKASGTRIETTHTDNGDTLVAITFNGKDQRIVLGSSAGGESTK